MSDTQQRTGGWREAVRRTSDSVLGLVQSRLELLAVEFQEEKLRVIQLLFWFVIAIALAVSGLLVALGALAVFLWNVAGYAGLIGLALAALASSAGALWALRRRIKDSPGPFADTIAEFRKDREWVRKND